MDPTMTSAVSESATWDFDNPSKQLIWPDDGEVNTSSPRRDDGERELVGAKRLVTISLPGKRHVKVSLRALNIFLSAMTVLFTVAMNVSLPILSDVGNEFSDAYYVLLTCTVMFPPFFFILLLISKLFDPRVGFRLKAPMKLLVLAGFLNSMNGLFLVYASDPSRTPPALQAILSTSVIPFTVVARYLILRKGVGIRRLVCTSIVMVGLFISMEPVIFDIDHADDTGSGKNKQTTLERILWPCAFLFGFLPLAIMNVVLERVKEQETSSALVNAWLNVYTLISVLSLFWTDFIPGFGMLNQKRTVKYSKHAIPTNGRKFDFNGGTLKDAASGVEIGIPKGAIPRGKRQLITLRVYIDSTAYSGIDLRKNESLMTPVVECMSPGLTRFLKPVSVKIPKSTSGHSDQMRYKLHYSQVQSKDENMQWKYICKNTAVTNDNSDVNFDVDKHYVTIKTFHFTRFVCSSCKESSDVHMEAVAIGEYLTPNEVCVRVYIGNATEDHRKKLYEKEESMIRSDFVRLRVREIERDWVISCLGDTSSPSDDWEWGLNCRENTKTIKNEGDQWCCGGGLVSKSFIFKEKEIKSTSFNCTFMVNQSEGGTTEVDKTLLSIHIPYSQNTLPEEQHESMNYAGQGKIPNIKKQNIPKIPRINGAIDVTYTTHLDCKVAPDCSSSDVKEDKRLRRGAQSVERQKRKCVGTYQDGEMDRSVTHTNGSLKFTPSHLSNISTDELKLDAGECYIEETPTSPIMQRISTDDMCSVRFRGIFDNRGGELQHPDSDVRLTIPEGAIPTGINQVIEVQVGLYPEHFNLKIADTGDRWYMSPVVNCLAHGLDHFEKPILLRLPHRAQLEDSNWEFTLHSSEQQSLDGNMTWNDVNPSTDNPDTLFEVKDEYVEVSLMHFTAFACTAHPKDISYIRLQSVAFGNYITSYKRPMVAIKVYVCDTIKDYKKQVEDNESDSIKSDVITIVKHVSDEPIEVTCHNDTRRKSAEWEWELNTNMDFLPQTQKIHLQQIMTCHCSPAVAPHCRFEFELKLEKTADSIHAMFSVKTSRNQDKRTNLISFDFPVNSETAMIPQKIGKIDNTDCTSDDLQCVADILEDEDTKRVFRKLLHGSTNIESEIDAVERDNTDTKKKKVPTATLR